VSDIKVKVKLLGHLMWYPDVKKKEHQLEVEKGITLEWILRELKVPVSEVSYVSVNGKRAAMDTQVKDNDNIEVIPSIGGG